MTIFMSLQIYLDKSSNSTVREAIFNYRLFYDIKIAAAKNNNDVQIYLPEIDNKGYDIIIDDNDTLKPFQIKTVNKVNSNKAWENIHKTLIRPIGELSFLLYGEFSPATTGIQGGFILINPILNKNKTDVQVVYYYYTDIVLITCFSLGLIKKYKTSQTKAEIFLQELIKGKSHDKIEVPIHLMVKVEDANSLLALCELHSIKQSSYLSNYLIRYLKAKEEKEKNDFIYLIKEFIRTTTNDEKLEIL